MLIDMEAAMHAASVSAGVIHSWIEGGQLHFRETPDGRIEVCHASLRKVAGRQ